MSPQRRGHTLESVLQIRSHNDHSLRAQRNSTVDKQSYHHWMEIFPASSEFISDEWQDESVGNAIFYNSCDGAFVFCIFHKISISFLIWILLLDQLHS